MRIARLLLLTAIIGGALHWWKSGLPNSMLQHPSDSHLTIAAESSEANNTSIIDSINYWWKGKNQNDAQSANGFIPATMPAGANTNTVMILAPLNCPSEGAQRAILLEAQLTHLGIPNVRTSHYSINIKNPTQEQQDAVQRALNVLNGEIPAVFINGMAKSNPTIDEVVSEYRISTK